MGSKPSLKSADIVFSHGDIMLPLIIQLNFHRLFLKIQGFYSHNPSMIHKKLYYLKVKNIAIYNIELLF